MALIRYEQPQIVVNISDLILDTTVIKRKARFDSMSYSQGNANSFLPSLRSQGNQQVVINLTIQYFSALPDGSYGESLEGKKGFNSYTVSLVANHTTLVDSTTGAIIGDASLLEDPTSTQAAYTDGNGVQHQAGVLYGKDYMYEDEYFRNLAVNIPVQVDSLITQYIQTASSSGRL